MTVVLDRVAALRACGLPPTATDEALGVAAQILECISDAFVFLDTEWRYRYVNAHAGRLFGRDPASLLGKHIWTEFPEGVGQPFHLAYERAFRDQTPAQIEAYYAPWNRWFENRIHPSRDGLAIFFHDVTEAHLAEISRRREEQTVQQVARARAHAEQMAHLGFWQWDLSTNQVHWSEELLRIYGIIELAPGASFEGYLERVHPDDRERVSRLISDALASGDTFQYDERIVRPGGEVRHLRSRGSVTRDGAGKPVSLLGSCLDITEQLDTQTALEQSEEWLGLALAGARLGLWSWDIQTDSVYWSAGAERVFGLASGAFGATSESFYQCIHPDDRAMVEARVRQVVARETEHSIEHRVLCPDGSVRWVAARGRVFRDAAGKAVRIAGSVFDITDARRAALERRRFEVLVENATDFIGLVAPDGQILYLNQAARNMVGIDSEAEARTKYVADLLTPEGVKQSLEIELVSVLQTGRWEGESQLVHQKSRRLIDVSVASFRVQDPATGGVICLGTVRHDITARRELEGQLRHAQKMDAVGRLAAGVAHDFNNLLTTIGGMAGLLARDPTLTQAAQSRIGEIESAAQRAVILTKQLLSFTRRQAYQPIVLDLNIVVAETCKLLRRLLPSEIELRIVRANAALPVYTDRGHVQQVLLNLVVNARDAMPHGGRLTVTTRDDHETISLLVTDTGTGMTTEVLERAFEPFFTTKDEGRGTGLGLSTVQGILTQNRAGIAVASQPGVGTTFTVTFPRSHDGILASDGSTHRPPRQRGRGTLLVVEDDATVRSTVRQILQSEGYRVLDTGDPDQAIRLARAHRQRIDAMLTNLHLPNMDGRELLKRIREENPKAKALFLSDRPEDGIADPVLVKPFATNELSYRIREALGVHDTELE